MRAVAVFCAAWAFGCGTVDSYRCAGDAECDRASGGRCELEGFCSYDDGACDSGRRFGPNAGDLSHSCVRATGGDGGPGSADGGEPDAGPIGNLLAYWPMDEMIGATTPDEAGDHDATLVNGYAVETEGQYATALGFLDPVFMAVPELENDAFPQKGTLSFWLTGQYAQADGHLFDQYDSDREHLFIRSNETGRIQFACQTPELVPGYGALIEITIAEGAPYHHLVMVWDTEADLIVYVDGIERGQDDIQGGCAPTAQRFTFMRGFDGALDEVRLYNRALTRAEVLDIR